MIRGGLYFYSDLISLQPIMCVFWGVSGIFPPFSNPGVTRLGRFFNPGVLKKIILPFGDLGADEFGWWRVLVEGVWCDEFGACESLM